MNDCIFCKIASGEIPSTKVYEDELCIAFLDIHPQSKEHILVIPRKHLDSLHSAGTDDAALLAHLMLICSKVAELRGIGGSGYRVVTNIGVDGCQSVGHLHLHVLGGEQLSASMA